MHSQAIKLMVNRNRNFRQLLVASGGLNTLTLIHHNARTVFTDDCILDEANRGHHKNRFFSICKMTLDKNQMKTKSLGLGLLIHISQNVVATN